MDIGRKVILQWPCNLVMPVKKGQSVWKRASKDFGHLTWKEQVESLHFFGGIKYMIEYVFRCGEPMPTAMKAYIAAMNSKSPE